MTKNKRLVSRMMFTLLVLTLVSFCCVGFTFARYTSSGDGTAAAEVAKWDVTLSQGNSAVTFGKLSPSMQDPSESTTRSKTTAAVKVLTITNSSDVDANVSIKLAETNPIEIAQEEVTASGLTLANITRHFTIKFYSDEACTKELDSTNKTVKVPAKTGTTAGTADIYAKVTWTTDLYDAENTAIITGAEADEEDTKIGQHITSLTFNLTYTAVQATEIPGETA